MSCIVNENGLIVVKLFSHGEYDMLSYLWNPGGFTWEIKWPGI